MRSGILLFLCLAAAVVAVGRETETEAAKVWDKMLAAKGGKEHLHGIESVLRSSSHAQNLRGRSCRDCPVEELFVFPDQFWQWADERPTAFGLSALTLDFNTGRRQFRWETDKVNRESLANRSTEAWRLELFQAGELLETRWMQLRPIRTWSETKNKVTSVFVECKFVMAKGGATAVFESDPATALPRRVILTEPVYSTPKRGEFQQYIDTVARHDFEILQYGDVSGIKMPAVLRHHEPFDFQEKVQYRFNVDYDPKIFERGPRIEDGPEGWRKREK